MTITISLDTILDRIYAESAWYAAYQPSIHTLTPDNQRMLVMKIEDGMNDLKARIATYITQWNFNPHIDTHNITIGLDTSALNSQEDIATGIVVELLAQYALMRFYNNEQAHFAAAWRVARARITMLLAHPN